MAILPDSAGNSGHKTPFAHAAPLYRAAGWAGVLPLRVGDKRPAVSGFHGAAAAYPEPAAVRRWCQQYPNANIGLHLGAVGPGREVIGIDVDDYLKGDKQKLGGSQLKALENEHGTLPDTWISSARSDGVSGIRYYRVPAGLAWRSQVEKDIECISKGNRYAAVWPSTNPDTGGTLYRWYPPGETPNGQNYADAVPDPTTLPSLLGPWVDYLTHGRMRDNGKPIDMDTSVKDLYAWADDKFGSRQRLCYRMNEKAAQHIRLIRDEATSHDKLVNAHMNILWLAQEGHAGWDSALKEVEKQFVATCVERDKRDRGELRGEIFRSRTNGLRRVKGSADQRTAIGAVAVDPPCECDAFGGFTMPTFGPARALRGHHPAYRRMYRPAYRPMGR